MGKISKKTIDARRQQLHEIGFHEEHIDGIGSRFTHPDLGGVVVTSEMVQNETDGNWIAIIEDANAKLVAKNGDDLPFTQAETVDASDAGQSVELTKRNAETDIVQFDMNEAIFAVWREQYGNIIIASLDDKENIKKAQEGKKFIRSKRTGLEAKRKALKAFYIEEGKKIDAAAAKYEGLIKEIEEPLDVQLNQYEEWLAEETTRKENEAKAELNRRVAKLQEAGLAFDGSFYSIGENISMDIVTIKAMDELSFEALVAKVEFEKQRLDKLKEEEEQRQREAAEQLRQNRLTLRSTVATSIGLTKCDKPGEEVYYGFHNDYANIKLTESRIAGEDDAIFASTVAAISSQINDAKQKTIDAANREAEEAKQQARRAMLNMREMTCKGIGLVFTPHEAECNGPAYIFRNEFANIILAKFELENLVDAEFANLIETYAPQINTAKDQQAEKNRKAEEDKRQREQQEAQERQQKEEADRKERERLHDRYISRTNDVVYLGMKPSGVVFLKEDNYGNRYGIAIDTLQNATDDEWMEMLAVVKENVKRIDDATAAKLQELKEQAAARTPQAERVRTYMADLLNVEKPTIEDPAIREVLTTLSSDIAGAIQKAMDALKKFN